MQLPAHSALQTVIYLDYVFQRLMLAFDFIACIFIYYKINAGKQMIIAHSTYCAVCFFISNPC